MLPWQVGAARATLARQRMHHDALSSRGGAWSRSTLFVTIWFRIAFFQEVFAAVQAMAFLPRAERKASTQVHVLSLSCSV